MSWTAAEEERVRAAYARRDAAGKSDLYAWHRQEVLFGQYRFRSVAASLFASNGLVDLAQLEILDLGCGTGGWLLTLLHWGASAARLHGIDLLQDRIDRAKSLMPGVDFRVASGYSIPYADASMDLVSAHTVFSSILDGQSRKAMAEEMARVLKPRGKIFIYDYRISDPSNRDTIGIGKVEIGRLFPSFNVERRTLTLAPPIFRRIAPWSTLLGHIIESCFPFLRTHAIYLITARPKKAN